MKKLVPTLRSRSSRMPAASSTGKVNRLSTAVTNHAQQVKGIRNNDMPLVRKLSMVAMKFNEPSIEPIQKIAIEIIHSVWPRFSPGPLLAIALSGGYAVQPEIGGPFPTKTVASKTPRATNVAQNESMFSRGNAISRE